MSRPVLIYDGDCPFCANYVRLLRLRDSFPELELLDARSAPDHPAVKLLGSRRLQVDDGMALVEGGRIHHGADAIYALADRRQGSLFGQATSLVFGSRALSRALYPFLRGCRNLTLKLLGRSKLGF